MKTAAQFDSQASLALERPGDVDADDILSRADLPVEQASVLTSSGRRYEIEAADTGDRVTVRARSGEIVLRIEVTDRGPVLSFAGADIKMEASGELALVARTIAIDAEQDMRIDVGGDRHTRVRGTERMESARIELQSNVEGVAIRAMESIRLDGEHIGLNDDPSPRPFDWSSLAGEDA